MAAHARPDGGAGRLPSLSRWTLLCAAAEGIGMTAAAAAARSAQSVAGNSPSSWQALAALAIIVAGGLVEGTALGCAQASALRQALADAARRSWILVTVAVAGLGWAAASAPAAFAGDARPGEAGSPPLALVLALATVLGAGMGALLGAAQALVLRGRVRHPRRWIAANALGWAPAMAVIFAGATSPAADWAPAAAVMLGTGTGIAAGAVLGLVTGWFLPSLDGPPPHNRVVLGILGSRAHRLAGGSLLGLRVRGTRTGRHFAFPVAYAQASGLLVVFPGRPDTKCWWRNLVTPTEVGVLRDGRWSWGYAELVRPDDPGYEQAVTTYRRRRPGVRIPSGAPMVVIRPASCWPTS